MDSFLPTTAPVQWPAALPMMPTGANNTRHYQLVAVAPGAAGRQRPVLGLRWYLPVYEQMGQQSGTGHKQPQFAKPFVLRATLGDCIETHITNLLPHTALCLGLVDDDYGILESACGEIAPGESLTCTWRCRHAGIYPIYNRASPDPVERRNLLGVLIIEP